MDRLARLCVFCGASNKVDQRHLDAAAAFGRLAATRGLGIVFGGGHVGLMGALAEAALATGGEVIGVIPEHLMVKEVGYVGLTRLEVVDSMHERKARMVELSDAFCVLPGGFGTLDETFEVLTWRQLGLHNKPILIVDVDGFWGPLRSLVDHLTAESYVHGDHRQLITFVTSVEAAVETAANALNKGKESSAALARL